MIRILAILLCFTVSATSQSLDNTFKKETQSSIIIYGSDSCHYCLETKRFLDNKEVLFTYYDIDEEAPKLQEMLFKMKKAGLSTANVQLPIVEKDGNLFMNDEPFETFLHRIIKD